MLLNGCRGKKILGKYESVGIGAYCFLTFRFNDITFMDEDDSTKFKRKINCRKSPIESDWESLTGKSLVEQIIKMPATKIKEKRHREKDKVTLR